MIRRRRTLLLGLALVALLAGGLAVAVLWPTPSEAERKAALIQVGMTGEQAEEVLGPPNGWDLLPSRQGRLEVAWHQADRSAVFAQFRPLSPETKSVVA
jgi:hypothetical protein